MKMSIIIPTWNEEENIGKLVPYLQQYGGDELLEIIVVDAGSQDNTLQIAKEVGADAYLSPKKGRAAQMNYGVTKAKGDLLYFVHADTLPPKTFQQNIQEAIAEGYPMGCFQYDFDSAKKILGINAYFTRFERLMCRGGDQTLFILRPIFKKLGGYKDDYLIMEDYDFIIRAEKEHKLKVMDNHALVSARKYDNNSYLRVNLTNLLIFLMFFLGFSQEKMVNTYKTLLDYR